MTRVSPALALALVTIITWSGRGAPAAQVSAQPPAMVLVEGRSFVMGTDEADIGALMAMFETSRRALFAPETPAHAVEVKSFLLDRTEVTNAAFAAFADRFPAHRPRWQNAGFPDVEREWPATFITWDAASAFCQAAGKRLPTEAEWELAAGGGGDAEFPWGDEQPDATRANWAGARIGRPTRVGSFPATGAGLYDLAGNVWEFVQDAWRGSYDAPAASAERRVIRGGSFGGAAVNLRVRYRDSHPADAPGPHVGFRCAR